MGGVLSGASGGNDPPEVHMTDAVNTTIQEGKKQITVCLSSAVDAEGKLVFVLSPHHHHKGGPFHELVKQLSAHSHDKLIIRYVDLIHCHSDHILEEFTFEIRDLFDSDAATDEVRERVDEAWKPNNPKETFPPPPPPSAKEKEEDGGPDVDAAVDRLIGKDPDEKPTTTTTTTKVSLPPPPDNDEDESWQLGSGIPIFRNVAERSNVIRVGPIAPGTFVKRIPLYKASISAHIVKWFAGQEHHVMNNTHQVKNEVDPRDMRRSPVMLTEWTVYARDHALISFIREFAPLLDVTNEDFRFLQDDRSLYDDKFIKVKLDLIKRAQQMIEEVVYAQIYYTTLRNCHLVYVPPTNTELQQYILGRVAHDWGLVKDEATALYNDWRRGAYSPCIALTFEVGYYVVSGVTNSAAAIRKDVTKVKNKK